VLNIVIPMAGRRPSAREFRTPESLIPVEGRPLIEWVVDSLRPTMPHRFHFLCRSEHLDTSPLVPFLLKIAPGCRVIPVAGSTGGSACTALLARGWIDSDAPLAIADPWRYVGCDLDACFRTMRKQDADALVLACPDSREEWPWARIPPQSAGTEAATAISLPDGSVAWICCFRRGRDFVRAADHMIFWEKRVDGQFQATAACNELIAEGARIEMAGVHEALGARSFDSPKGLHQFQSRRAVA